MSVLAQPGHAGGRTVMKEVNVIGTMQLLADKLVELKIVESISDETVRRTLKRGAQALAV